MASLYHCCSDDFARVPEKILTTNTRETPSMKNFPLVRIPRRTIMILPVECVDLIIGWLDKATLKCCTLVCGLWAYLCQQRLFNHIRVRACPGSLSESARRLLEIISRSPHIGVHIRSLQLDAYNYRLQGGYHSRLFSIEQRALAFVLPELHRLSSLSLNGPGNQGFDFSPPLLEALRSTLISPQLVHLSLSRWNLADFKEITSLMGNHPWSIETLRLHEIHFGDPTSDEKAPNSKFITTINTFEVNSCDLLKITNWILSVNISPPKKLILVNVDRKSVLPFIELFSSHLEELSLSCVYSPLNFGDLPELRVLFLGWWGLNHVLEGLETFRRNNYLETLSIFANVHDNASVVSQLKKLDCLLSSTHAFPSLKLVKMDIMAHNTKTYDSAGKEALVLLLERGILRLKVSKVDWPVDSPSAYFTHLWPVIRRG